MSGCVVCSVVFLPLQHVSWYCHVMGALWWIILVCAAVAKSAQSAAISSRGAILWRVPNITKIFHNVGYRKRYFRPRGAQMSSGQKTLACCHEGR